MKVGFIAGLLFLTKLGLSVKWHVAVRREYHVSAAADLTVQVY